MRPLANGGRSGSESSPSTSSLLFGTNVVVTRAILGLPQRFGSFLLLSEAGSLLAPTGVEDSRCRGWRSDLAKEPEDIRSPTATSANISSKAARNNFSPTEEGARPWRVREIFIVESSQKPCLQSKGDAVRLCASDS